METTDCQEPEVLQPRVHLGRCEGKNDCVEVCPYGVFEVRKAIAHERAGLTWLENLKSLAHGHKKAFVINAAQCHACGYCVTVCPEKAIKLERCPR
jgi:NAD-dependent dihydropyrimidine dehydrogenase PreA subunit